MRPGLGFLDNRLVNARPCLVKLDVLGLHVWADNLPGHVEEIHAALVAIHGLSANEYLVALDARLDIHITRHRSPGHRSNHLGPELAKRGRSDPARRPLPTRVAGKHRRLAQPRLPVRQQWVGGFPGDYGHIHQRVILLFRQDQAIDRWQIGSQPLHDIAVALELKRNAFGVLINKGSSNDSRFLNEYLRQLIEVPVHRSVRAAFKCIGDHPHCWRQALRAQVMGVNADCGRRYLRSAVLRQKFRRGRDGVAIANDDDVFVAGVGIFEAFLTTRTVQGHPHRVLKMRHVALLHLLGCRLGFASISLCLQRKVPLRALAGPAIGDDPHVVICRKSVDGLQGGLGSPVVAVFKFAGMHDHHQRALADLFAGGHFHVYRENLLDLGSLPTSGPESLRPAEHHHAAAHFVNISREDCVLFLVDPARAIGHIGQQHGVVVLERE